MTDRELLGIDEDATPERVKDRYRELALTKHPDRGGDADEFAELHLAYQRALLEAEDRAKTCPSCRGKGKNEVRSGFNILTLTCAECGGTGER